ncbi:putative Cilia- and flagella-associated protein 410 [Blattamonas nauphoetae]|uniref:Cilia- and flagella-associated protein 410 n=1 Tax=Blattamonas nauphoetae TaxID=2049346 RepID=A0ABQ9XD57_9EUKA|nr:putative Cilia- and flagella-associated protein 410 [Blattamonas nauphoetae]
MTDNSTQAVLTESLIFQATHLDNLEQVKKINLWGRNIVDISVIEKLPNIEVVALSINKIQTLKPFRNCRNLRELYVRKNDITDYHEIDHLANLPSLTTVWLDENPCVQFPGYTDYVIAKLQHLEKLDNRDVTEEERQNAKKAIASPSHPSHQRQTSRAGSQSDLQPSRRPVTSASSSRPSSAKRPQTQASPVRDQDERQQATPQYGKYDSEHTPPERQRRGSQGRYADEPLFNDADKVREPERPRERDRGREREYDGERRRDERDYDERGYREDYRRSPARRYDDYTPQSVRTTPQHQRTPSSSRDMPGNHNVLYAVIALLNELDDEQLEMVEDEIRRKTTVRREHREERRDREMRRREQEDYEARRANYSGH